MAILFIVVIVEKSRFLARKVERSLNLFNIIFSFIVKDSWYRRSQKLTLNKFTTLSFTHLIFC